MDTSNQLRIGCPVWSCPDWRGTVYRINAPRSAWLQDYSQKFSAVEGNSTFYGIPKPDTFRRWADETVDGFRFVLKFPRSISHELQLVNAERVTEEFLAGVSILHEADRLGPSFLQLAPSFGPLKMEALGRYLERLPVQFPWAVEIRHPDFFEPPAENELDAMLAGLSIDRVIFDSRPLFSAPPDDEIEQVAQQRKPQVPIRKVVTGSHPILRLIGRNDLSTMQPWIDEWSEQINPWIDAKLSPYIFCHTPNDRHAPEFAQLMLKKLCPGSKPIIAKPVLASSRRQLRMF